MALVDSLPSMDFSGRVDRLRAALPAAGCEAFVVSDLVNIRYLTGFTGSNASMLVHPDGVLFLTDGRYREQSQEQLDASGVDATVEITRDFHAALRTAARGIGRIGLEADAVTWSEQRTFAHSTFPWAHLVPTFNVLLEMRRVKDAGEVARLRTASGIADGALAAARDLLHQGVSERVFGRALEDEMFARGSDAPSFETIVASGPNGAKPHARPTERIIGSDGGELVVIDFGATVDGYHSDMTRTYAVGELTATQQRMFDVVAESQAAGVAAVQPGATGVHVDAVCRTVIADAGWGDAFLHGTGHGIGLVIHEDPRVSAQSKDTLDVGHCVTVEPGVYLPEHGGVRIEDSVVVTPDGCDKLTAAPYT